MSYVYERREYHFLTYNIKTSNLILLQFFLVHILVVSIHCFNILQLTINS